MLAPKPRFWVAFFVSSNKTFVDGTDRCSVKQSSQLFPTKRVPWRYR